MCVCVCVCVCVYVCVTYFYMVIIWPVKYLREVTLQEKRQIIMQKNAARFPSMFHFLMQYKLLFIYT